MDTLFQLFEYLLTGMQSVFGFVMTLPSLLMVCVQAFPPILSVVLVSFFGCILAIRVLELLP